MKKRNSNHIGLCKEDKILYSVITMILILLIIVILYPLIYVVSCSFSSGEAVSSGKIILWPVDISLQGYKAVFSYRQVWVGYANTIFYTVVGSVISVVLTTMAAYPLSRKNFQGRKYYTIFFMIPMFFSGGIIPTYLLMTKLHLIDTRWAIIFASAMSIFNMVIMRTFFQNSIPNELLEAAKIDGVSDFGYLFKIVIPLSKAIFAVITLYYAVAQWNSYFNAILYLRTEDLFPLQMVLRDILNASKMDLSQVQDPEILRQMRGLSDVMKYALIVVSSVPILVAYPFVQKFFEKGVMIGSVKG